ncbi:hypothetical protein F0562_031846 [Nyssa sinensis]|uniref:Uncharacterized protein n=1 Tax=Nyssa sinensis TaxID=561372 RepID=A0A5J5AY07_9ASTE|nr:hypothetical protein F0562_031846 [Nyssa sinensis]
MSGSRFLFANGVVLPPSDTPSVSTFLEAHPGAYTTSRTHNNVLPVALKERKSGEELAITALVSGNSEKLSDNDSLTEDKLSRILDVYVHVGIYIPPVFGIQENGAHLAVVGRGRDVANAKYSDWVRLRKPLEKLRLPSVTELLLSNDRDRILEGCVTNFFVVCRKGNNDISNDAKGKDLYDYRSAYSVEIQTAPISDGVLPGVIRQVIIDVCSSMGIPLREVAPSWSESEIWEEAFIDKGFQASGHSSYDSLRLLQHVETIQVPSSLGIAGIKILEGGNMGGEAVQGGSWEDHCSNPERDLEESRL